MLALLALTVVLALLAVVAAREIARLNFNGFDIFTLIALSTGVFFLPSIFFSSSSSTSFSSAGDFEERVSSFSAKVPVFILPASEVFVVSLYGIPSRIAFCLRSSASSTIFYDDATMQPVHP